MDPINPLENLSRFLFSERHFSIQNKRVKYGAFLPANNGETSVFRTSDISDDEIWDIGEREVVPFREKPMLARADITADTVLSNGLEIAPNEPPEKHANIKNWPDDRSKQKMIAIELASNARLHLVEA